MYGLTETGGERSVMVIDLGGGTCDVSLLKIDQGLFQVISSWGNTLLGGEDFNKRVMDYLIKKIHHEFKHKIEDFTKFNKTMVYRKVDIII